MKLHYRTEGEGKPLIILHGLFGSSDNWQTLGKSFAEQYKVYFVDQRNHGHSPHSDEFNYDLLAEDLHELLVDIGASKVHLLGHSMGGKTVMAFAAKYPQMVDKLIVADIGVKRYPMHHDVILDALKSLDLNQLKSRGQADKKMAEKIEDWGVRQFLLKNLYWVEKGQLGWRINIPVLEAEMENILDEIKIDSLAIETLFIRGEKSNYILESDYPSIQLKFPNSKIETLLGAGHWVHAEAPEEFYKLVMNFLKS